METGPDRSALANSGQNGVASVASTGVAQKSQREKVPHQELLQLQIASAKCSVAGADAVMQSLRV